jgi:serine/threonine protein kinase
MPLEIGTRLHDRYQIEEELGRGGMGAVYRARDENIGIDVAIKENLVESADFERQFKREAAMLASLRHPGLPRVSDYFTLEGQRQYLVMDYIPGEDARQVLVKAEGKLPIEQVLGWGLDLAEALVYLHNRTQPIIHRDIKPGNIKITPDGHAVLVDFGLAKAYNIVQTTTIGAKAFTPGFAPPEQYGVGTGRTDPRTDIYALGATLYNLLTGKLPADSMDRAMGTKALAPIRELRPKTPASVAEVLERALAVKPEDRWPSAVEFRDAFKQAVTASQAPATAPATPQPDVPLEAASPLIPTKRRWAIPGTLFAGIVILGLAVAGGAWWMNNNPPGSPAPTTARSLAPSEGSETAPARTSPPSATTAPTQNTTPASTATPAPSSTPAFTPTLGPTARGGGHGEIAYVSDETGQPQLYVMNVDGSNARRLTTLPDGACQPAWSPDGASLLFITPCAGKADLYPNAAIYLINADGSGLQPFISQPGGVFDADWSKTGVAFTSLEQGTSYIYLADSAGGEAKQISAARSADSQPSWSADGERLVFFNASRAGLPTLYWMFKDGSFGRSQPDQVTRDQRVSAPAWSPAGDLVAYISNTQVWIVTWDAKGFGAQQLTTRGPNDTPHWSPDGKWIVYESWREAANHDIYIMTSNGGLQTRLTSGPAIEMQPAWRP